MFIPLAHGSLKDPHPGTLDIQLKICRNATDVQSRSRSWVSGTRTAANSIRDG